MIDAYSFGRIVVDGKEFEHDIIILPDEIKRWKRKESHTCGLADIDFLKTEKFELLLIGTGYSGCMNVLKEVFEFFGEKGVELKVVNSREAVKELNLLSTQKRVVACLHLTC